MTRPIKFRAWKKPAKSWAYFEPSDFFDDNYAEKPEWYGEWLQFTGLTDKNGKEIYEGDIVRIPKSAHVFADMMTEADHEDLEKENGKFCIIEWEGTGFTGVGLAYVEQGEVIGNKCENPELLEAK